ncbi:MAG: transaldolase family protein [Chloroflexota bacterium]
MPSDYFHKLNRETPTRFWVNNPSGAEMEQAIAAGAINCTTNPAYCSKLLSSEPHYLRSVIDETITQVRDVDEAAVRIYQRTARRVLDRFRPLYDESKGACGYVTIQDDPREDQNAEAIVRCVLANRKLGPNYMAKIPVIQGGLEALETCVEENIAICATEVFSISQAIHMCELYERTAKRTGNYPPFYVTHISGIFDEYLDNLAQREGIEIAPQVLAQAGCAVARREYRLLQERGYHTTLLGGGARGAHHFTEMVGGDVHITINWSTAQEIMAAGAEIAPRMDIETPQAVIDELRAKFPDFCRAYDQDGLAVEEYAGYGPVQFFRNAFLRGWYLLLAEIVARRNAYAL